VADPGFLQPEAPVTVPRGAHTVANLDAYRFTQQG